MALIARRAGLVWIVVAATMCALSGCTSGSSTAGPADQHLARPQGRPRPQRPTPSQRPTPIRPLTTTVKSTTGTPPTGLQGVPLVDVPDPGLTPGAAFHVSAATVCVSGYASSVRDVPDSEKEAVYARYGIVHVPYAHEVDHLVSLEIGGSNAISNLWPEPYAGRWGARTKDVLENRLHDLVCSGTLTLAYAQHVEATNWVAAYLRYVGAPPPASSPPPAHQTTSHSPPPGGNCEPGYSPCLPIVADLDCGDIPDYLKPIHVTGSDPYRLDADGDGLGCEP